MLIEHRKGQLAGQLLKGLALSRGDTAALAGHIEGLKLAAEERKQLQQSAALVKSAVGALTLGGNGGLQITEVGQSFLDALQPTSIVSRFTAAQRVPMQQRLVDFGQPATAVSNLGEGMPIAVTRSTLTATYLHRCKTCALTVVSRDVLRLSKAGTEDTITAGLAASVGAAEDVAFLSPAVVGSILNGAQSIASSGATVADVDKDLKSAIAALIGARSTLANALWIIGSNVATTLSLMRTSSGELAYEDVTIRGGTLAGLPVLVSAGVSGFIALVDQVGVALSDDVQVALDASEESVIEQSDAPINNSVAPTPAQVVSMFQTDSIALRALIFRGWALVRPGLAVYISGVSY